MLLLWGVGLCRALGTRLLISGWGGSVISQSGELIYWSSLGSGEICENYSHPPQMGVIRATMENLHPWQLPLGLCVPH